jgi:hypothetical protein
MIIRFENHWFYNLWGKSSQDRFDQHFRYRSDKKWLGHQWRSQPEGEWQSFHGNQANEWRVFEFARGIDEDAAIQSISMGAPQIMGFNYRRVGFRTPVEMFDSFSSSIAGQIRGLFDFCTEPMLEHLRQRDFEEFAGFYNGQGNKREYGRRIRNHYHALKNLQQFS